MEKEFEYKEEYGWLTNICLNVTDACNLACRYCFVEQHPHYMTLDVAKQAVHFILDNLEKKNKKFNENKHASITYFGGEPTLMWNEIIVPLTIYIKENNFPIDLNITTNGTLLNKERILFLKKNGIIPLLSIDGDKETQDYNRPCINSKLSSFDLVVKNIPFLLEVFPKTTFRSTIYAPTADKTFENYIFAIQQGFDNIFLIPNCRDEWTEQQKEALHQEIHKIFSFMDFCFSNNVKPINFSTIKDAYRKMLQIDLLTFNNAVAERYLKRNVFRCGLGTTFGSIGYDGSIYGCQEQPSKSENNIFYLGNIFNDGISKEKHITLLKNYNQEKKVECNNKLLCKECIMQKYCINTNCPSSTYDLYKDFFIASEINCLWEQWILEDAIVLNNKLVKENNQLFQSYLDIDCEFNKNLKRKK